jgi:hypothetical protein
MVLSSFYHRFIIVLSPLMSGNAPPSTVTVCEGLMHNRQLTVPAGNHSTQLFNQPKIGIELNKC